VNVSKQIHFYGDSMLIPTQITAHLLKH